jgi:peptide/nickel transport system substrate-binding protein
MRHIAWVLAAAALVGCGGGDGGKSTAAAAPGADRPDPHPRPAGAMVVADAHGIYGGRYVATLRYDPKTWNCLTANETSTTDITNGLLYEGMVAFDNQTQETGPQLAASWEHSDDGLTWIFHLREGLAWSDGQPLTADDVLFSARILYDETIHPSSAELLKAGGKPFRFEKRDDRTVVITLPEPYGPFLSVIGALYIMPKHALEAAYEAGAFESTYGVDTPPADIVTGGPWTVAEYLPQQKIVLRPNPYYYKYDAAGHRLPYLDEIVYLIVPDQDAEVLKFQSGESDEIYFRAEDYALLKKGEADGGYAVYNLGPEMGTQMMWFNLNTRKNPETGRPFVPKAKQALFGDIRFRRAVAHAVDRQAISRTVYYGMAEPLYGPIPPVNKRWHNPDIVRYMYNLDEARRILDEAGYTDRNGDGIREDAAGNPLAFTLLTNADSRERVAMGNILADDLGKIGIKCTLAPTEFNALITKLRSSFDYDAILLGLTGGVPPDPIMSANVFMSSGVTHFWNPEQTAPGTAWEAEVDSLMRAQVTLSDDAARKTIFDRVQRIVTENVPMMYTVGRPGFIAVRNRFTGLRPTVLRPWVLWSSETVAYDPAGAARERAARSEE